ncbi:MAG: cell envelope integrity protein TolA [Cellvibrionales bacterium]|nr:cell envelope integrity protein TolA [Cellvibrionales bacterium]TXH51700.1 MAG: cell envelope integrity protein TolA [Cellvibrionales bacterium]
MSEVRDDSLIRPLWASVGLHALIVALMTVSWLWHTEQKVMAPPAMMKAALVYAPKSTMPQQRTQTEKTEKTKPKPEPPKPEPPKPEVVKPKEKPPEIKPVDKPSPVVVKPEPPKPEPKKPEPKKTEPKKTEPPKPKVEPKKQPEKKTEPPKPDAKQAAQKKAAQSAIQKEKVSKDADMAIQAMLNDEDITRTGVLSDEQIAKWAGLFADLIENNWNRPPNARQGMVVVLRIQLLPNGQVKDVQVVQSSGDRAFDLAAEAAVRKVETFKDITDKMKPEELKMFSDFDLKFDPQDLLM